jgi:dienelactone hydrolase
MSFPIRRTLAALVIAGPAALLLAPAPSAPAQAKKDDKTEEVTFTTCDFVELRGTYYKPNKGGNSPVVLMLHAWGKDRSKADWHYLASKIQEAGAAVLTFDFRGHGGSTNVSLTPGQSFWDSQSNRSLVKGASPKKNKISIKDFPRDYVPFLVNDIAAARMFLDQKNDSGECNTSNLILLGAQEGAALGYVWAAAEWQRAATWKEPNVLALPTGGKSAGNDIAACVWLSFERAPRGVGVNYAQLLSVSPQLRTTPMCFLYGEDDGLGKKDAEYMYNAVLRAKTGEPKLDKTYEVPIKKTKLVGMELINKPMINTEELIQQYSAKMIEKRNVPRMDRNVKVLNGVPIRVPLRNFGFSHD